MKLHMREGGGGVGAGEGGGEGGGGGGQAYSGLVGGGYVGEPLPQGAPFLIFDPLADCVYPDDFNSKASFPWSGWRPDLFGVIALAEFARTEWRCVDCPEPPSDRETICHEIEQLISMARDERPALVNEILDQNARLRGYFAQVLMFSAWSHPNALKILEMALRVGQLVAVYFKLKFNRGRPQQVFPALVPLVDSPRHASFPSGHSLESHMIALALAEVMPQARKPLITLANRIGRNREVAGVHYPTDTDAGRVLACNTFPLLRDCPIFQTVLKAAKHESDKNPGELHPPEECDETKGVAS